MYPHKNDHTTTSCNFEVNHDTSPSLESHVRTIQPRPMSPGQFFCFFFLPKTQLFTSPKAQRFTKAPGRGSVRKQRSGRLVARWDDSILVTLYQMRSPDIRYRATASLGRIVTVMRPGRSSFSNSVPLFAQLFHGKLCLQRRGITRSISDNK